MKDSKSIGGILLLYYHPLRQDAPTIMDHVDAFQEHSRFKVWNVNTAMGFPHTLGKLQFQVIVLHYSLFGSVHYMLDERFMQYLYRSSSSYKVAFFQDEILLCQQRFKFLNEHKIDCVYTLVEPVYFKDFYQKFTNVPKLINYIPGYVSEKLIAAARRFTLPNERRTIDVGYRARSLPFALGKGAREKTDVATGFLKRAANLGLRLDIKTDERERLYGDAWYRFIANCRAVLGAEAGASFTDIDDVAHQECERLISENPTITFEELYERVLHRWEGFIPQRVISPRHFEAAAFRATQILFEGNYSGIMQPLKHYIPLRKDFSNFEEGISLLNDPDFCYELRERAYQDLIASGDYSYRRFITEFDLELNSEGLRPDVSADLASEVSSRLQRDTRYLQLRARRNAILYSSFPGRNLLALLARTPVQLYRNLRRAGKDEKASP